MAMVNIPANVMSVSLLLIGQGFKMRLDLKLDYIWGCIREI